MKTFTSEKKTIQNPPDFYVKPSHFGSYFLYFFLN